MFYTIGEMAKRLGVPTSTLRFYDKEGILPFMQRTGGGIRMFSDSDYGYLKLVECLKKSGLSLKDIKDFIGMVLKGDETIEQRLGLFQKRKEEVEKQQIELQNTLDILRYKCWFYETAKAAGTTAALENLNDDEIPVEFQEVRRILKGKSLNGKDILNRTDKKPSAE